MGEALDAYLGIAAPHLSPRLVSPEALEHLGRIACQLPPTSVSGFECRLGQEEARADLGVRFLAEDGSRAVLAGRGDPEGRFALSRFTHPVWQRLRRFGARWDDPGSRLAEEVGDIFLEFDVEGPPEAEPLPAFFIEYARQAPRRLEVLEEALALLWAEPLAPAVRERLVACLAALPAGARVSAVGAMFSRRFEGVRLCLHGLTPATLPGYLERVGWPGTRADWEPLLTAVAPGVERIALGLDVGARVLPRLGVECHLAESLQEADTARWSSLLGELEVRGVCLPDKRRALLDWVGHTHLRARPEALPAHLRAQSAALGPQALPVFLRRINHVKLVFQPGQPPEAKAYLALIQRWLGRDRRHGRYVFGDLHEVRASLAP